MTFQSVSLCMAAFLCSVACGSESAADASRPSMAATSSAAGSGSTAPAGSDSTPVITPSGDSASAQSPVINNTSKAPDVTSCRAGHYIGMFFGEYHSAAWFEGTEPIMFATGDFDG